MIQYVLTQMTYLNFSLIQHGIDLLEKEMRRERRYCLMMSGTDESAF